MSIERTSDRWIAACDLCGDLRFKTIRLPAPVVARQCRSCGLVSLGRDQNGPLSSSVGVRSAMRALETTLARAVADGAARALLIGRAGGRVLEALRSAGLEVTVVGDLAGEAPAGLVVHTVPIEQAPFLPDQFDVIVCTPAIETFPAPSLVFEKCRLWLGPGGLLLLGGMNWGSAGARISTRVWLAHHAARARYLITPRVLRRYADRYGYDVRSVQTYSRSERTADGGAKRRERGLLGMIAMAPLNLALSFVGLGEELYIELEKRGVAISTLPVRAQEERDAAQGLAPAMYRNMAEVARLADSKR